MTSLMIALNQPNKINQATIEKFSARPPTASVREPPSVYDWGNLNGWCMFEVHEVDAWSIFWNNVTDLEPKFEFSILYLLGGRRAMTRYRVINILTQLDIDIEFSWNVDVWLIMVVLNLMHGRDSEPEMCSRYVQKRAIWPKEIT